MERNKIYFASDVHLGAPNYEKSIEREKLFVQWLSEIQKDAKVLYLVGDIWDMWFEYKTVVPKGFVRLLGKLMEMSNAGIEIHFFIGNHDMWMFNYLSEEMNIKTHREAFSVNHFGKRFFIAHGDGLGPNDKGYKFIKSIFANRICQFLFSWIHPDIGLRIAQYWSAKSRIATGNNDDIFQGNDKEFLYQYVKRKQEIAFHDFFIFGHRHLPLDMKVENKSRYINLGDWIKYNSYAVFDGENVHLKYYQP